MRSIIILHQKHNCFLLTHNYFLLKHNYYFLIWKRVCEKDRIEGEGRRGVFLTIIYFFAFLFLFLFSYFFFFFAKRNFFFCFSSFPFFESFLCLFVFSCKFVLTEKTWLFLLEIRIIDSSVIVNDSKMIQKFFFFQYIIRFLSDSLFQFVSSFSLKKFSSFVF